MAGQKRASPQGGVSATLRRESHYKRASGDDKAAEPSRFVRQLSSGAASCQSATRSPRFITTAPSVGRRKRAHQTEMTVRGAGLYNSGGPERGDIRPRPVQVRRRPLPPAKPRTPGGRPPRYNAETSARPDLRIAVLPGGYESRGIQREVVSPAETPGRAGAEGSSLRARPRDP